MLLYLPVYRSHHHLKPLIWSLAALEAYQATLGQKPITLKWFLDFADVRRLPPLATAKHPLLQANGCLCYSEEQVGGTGPQFALGTKGQLSVELRVSTGRISPPLAHDGVLPNALWRLIWALNSLKNSHEEVTIEGFYDSVQPLEDGQTAVLYTLPDVAQAFAQHWGIEQPLLGLQGLQFHYAHLLTPTCTVSSITDTTSTGGEHTAESGMTLPTQAAARLVFHLVPAQDPLDIFAKLSHHLQAQGFPDVEISLLDASHPLSTERTHPFVQAIEEASTSVYGHPPFVLPLSAGSYPLASLHLAGNTPVVLDLMPMSDAPAHSGDRTQHVAQYIKQLAMIMDKCTRLS